MHFPKADGKSGANLLILRPKELPYLAPLDSNLCARWASWITHLLGQIHWSRLPQRCVFAPAITQRKLTQYDAADYGVKPHCQLTIPDLPNQIVGHSYLCVPETRIDYHPSRSGAKEPSRGKDS